MRDPPAARARATRCPGPWAVAKRTHPTPSEDCRRHPRSQRRAGTRGRRCRIRQRRGGHTGICDRPWLQMPVFTYVDSGHRAGPTLTADATTQTHTLNVITREHGVLTESETVYNLKMLAGASPAACWITNLVRQNFSGALNLVDFNLARSLNTATAECAPSRSSVELHVSNVPINCE